MVLHVSSIVSSGDRLGLIPAVNKAVCSPFLLYSCRKALSWKYFKYGIGNLSD